MFDLIQFVMTTLLSRSNGSDSGISPSTLHVCHYEGQVNLSTLSSPLVFSLQSSDLRACPFGLLCIILIVILFISRLGACFGRYLAYYVHPMSSSLFHFKSLPRLSL